MLGTAFLWYAITFWAYLETRSVITTAFLGGAYMLGMAVLGVPFGSLIDRFRKHVVMMASAIGTTVFFLLAGAIYLLVPADQLIDLARPWFWLFSSFALIGAMLAMIRGLALSTCVTMLIESDRRVNANGMVGTVNGVTMLVTGVLSGLAIGQLGLGPVILISIVAMAASLVHLALIRIPEPTIVHADGTPKAVDFKAAWGAVIAVPGLIGLIIFSTFNNFLGGVFMSLLDAYGLELMSVELWGILFGVSSVGFIIGGALIAKFGLGSRPLKALLLACLLMWIISGLFTIRASVPLLVAGIVVYMAIIPVIEAAEQTLLQRVVPLSKQGRVFGFAQAIEVAAAPLSAFLIGPIAEFWLIPYAKSPEGRQQWSWLLGEGPGRGIALVFLLVSIIGFILTSMVFFTRTYRRLSAAYAAGDVNADVTADADDPAGPSPDLPGPDVLGKGYTEH
ncbi:MFS transporter [Tessaracoccus aquimaris]|uniref:MFS transporter n=2 Tax=Tessaracoccus aquimaris TaxID=1332264 RepID=A0A1Q2CTA5_9ACTN|nr:MFS transporter [Tessaracoccus aquimaris]